MHYADGGFAISFPSKPLYSKESSIRSFVSNKTTLLKQYQSQYGGASYTVGFARMVNTVPLNDFYTHGRNGMLANLNATLLLEKDVLQRINLLRVYLSDMNAEEAMNELLKRMRGTKDNQEFLASMNG